MLYEIDFAPLAALLARGIRRFVGLSMMVFGNPKVMGFDEVNNNDTTQSNNTCKSIV